MQRFSRGVSGGQSVRVSRVRPVRYEPMAIGRERFHPVPPSRARAPLWVEVQMTNAGVASSTVLPEPRLLNGWLRCLYH